MEILGKRCLLVMLKEEDRELDEMLNTLSYRVISKTVQKRRYPDTRYYVGSGKLKEIKEMLGSMDVDRVVVDGVLTPAQHHNIEHELGKDVRDRVWLVLEIFEKNATSYEAKLQVDLARMQYMSPFIREWIHKSKEGEHPGFMGGGEYGLDDYYLFIKRKRKQIIEELKRSEMHGVGEKDALKEKGWLVVGIAGYTNAGKSTLHDALCKSSVEVSPLMFTTLQPKSSSVHIWNAKIVAEDTIGFVEGLPNDVIEGFRVILNRLKVADIVLLVIDASEPIEEIRRKTRVSWDILKLNEILNVCPVLNKIDAAEPGNVQSAKGIVKEMMEKEPILVSAIERRNLDSIIETLLQQATGITQASFRTELGIGPEILNSAFENMIYHKINVLGDTMKVDYYCRSELSAKINSIIERGSKPVRTE